MRLFSDFSRIFDLFLVLTVLNALDGRSLPGMLGGLICGLMADTFSGLPFGLHGFADTLAGYATARIAQRLATRRWAGLAAVLLAAAVLQQSTLILLTAWLIPDPGLPELAWVAVRVGTSAILGLFFYLAGARARQRLETSRRTRKTPLKLG
jgi:rod shape-determining protein MreD